MCKIVGIIITLLGLSLGLFGADISVYSLHHEVNNDMLLFISNFPSVSLSLFAIGIVLIIIGVLKNVN